MIKVSGCDGCPFVNYLIVSNRANCNVGGEQEDVNRAFYSGLPAPLSCPLRKGPITVQLQEQ